MLLMKNFIFLIRIQKKILVILNVIELSKILLSKI